MANRNQLDAFARVLLPALKAPQTDRNIYAITLWAQSEGVKPYANNPLATTEPWPGAGSYNSAGVKTYRTISDGAHATAKTLTTGQPSYGYGRIIAELRRGNAPRGAIYSAINQSSWCRGCSGGLYPLAMQQWAAGDFSGAPPGAVQAPVPPPPRSIGETGWDYSPAIHAAGRAAGRHAQAIGANAARIRQLASRRGRLHP